MVALQWAKQSHCSHLSKTTISNLRLELILPPDLPKKQYIYPPIINLTETPLPRELKTQPPTKFSEELHGVGPIARIEPNLCFSQQLGLIFEYNEEWTHLQDWGWVYVIDSKENKFEIWSPIWGYMRWDQNNKNMVPRDPDENGNLWPQPLVICN